MLVLQYGPVFSFTMVGKTFTYLVGSDAAALFFDSKNESLNAEEVYSKLTTPVFGRGVAYDCPNHVSGAWELDLALVVHIFTGDQFKCPNHVSGAWENVFLLPGAGSVYFH